MKGKSTFLLVVSCDSYADVWQPFFTLFFRYWPDCPYPVFLGANNRIFPDRRVRTIPVGEDRDWSSNLLAMLRMIPGDDLLLMQEDFLLDKTVDTARVVRLIENARKMKAACMRLMPIPGPDIPCPDDGEIGWIRKGSAYRVSLQAAWWDKQILMSLIKPGESPWQYEQQGSRRSEELDPPFLSLRRNVGYPLDYFTTAVFRGYWEPGAVALCKREGIDVDLTARGMMPVGMRLERTLHRHGIPGAIARLLASPFGRRQKKVAGKADS